MEMKDIGILLMAACSEAKGNDLREGEANGEPVKEGSGVEVLCLRGACLELLITGMSADEATSLGAPTSHCWVPHQLLRCVLHEPATCCCWMGTCQ